MTGGNEPVNPVNGQIPPILEEDTEEDGILEIAAKKNRQRFAINKSYSIEVIFDREILLGRY